MASKPYVPTPKRVIIIGTGWYGLACAKTYLQLNPAITLTLIDENKALGGVWSRTKLYPELIADSPIGCFEFSDLPMEGELWGDIPGETVSAYFEEYAEMFGLKERMRLGVRVVECREVLGVEGRGWEVDVLDEGEGERRVEVIRCDKLIVATGFFSQPAWPNIDISAFRGLVMHSADVGARYEALRSEEVKNVVVVGGNKSAAEIVNLCALRGKKVTWVIRKDGSGPGMLLKAKTNGVHAAVVAYSRWSGVPSPNILNTSGFWYWFLHSGKSRLGLWVTAWYWRLISKIAFSDKYEKSENGKKIRPDMPHFLWSTSGAGALHDNSTLMEMIDEGTLIDVHRDSIVSMSDYEAKLSDGTVLPADAVVFATGWGPSQSVIFKQPLCTKLGLPVPLSQQPVEFEKYWNKLDTQADQKICSLFPMLKNPPKTFERKPDVTPGRMYREMVPIDLAAESDRSIIFLGAPVNAQVSIHAEVSSLWGVSYLEGILKDGNGGMLGDKEKMDKQTSEVLAWMRRRYRRAGIVEPTALLEIQAFTDLLLKDLGLRSDRRRAMGPVGFMGLRGWVREWFQPYRPPNYKGIVEEYMRLLNQTADKDRSIDA